VTTLVYTAAAERDLTQIALYIAADNPQAARHFVERIRRLCAHLVRFPELGPRRPNILPGVRSLALGSYIVYYRRNETRDEVQILRIWHGRRSTITAADVSE
jgi:toxin ParE1/3/4